MPDLDPTATEHAWVEGRQRLVRFLLSRGATPEDAEDIVHDLLLKAIERGSAGGRPGALPLPRWLHAAAMNALVDRSRREGTRRRNLPSREPVHDPRGEAMSREGLLECLEPFLALLPEGDRKALLLADAEDVPQAEVARRLGLSLPGAKSRIQRARRRLRAVYEVCCSFEQDARGGIVAYEPRRGCADDCRSPQRKRPRA